MKASVVAVLLSCVCGCIVAAPAPALKNIPPFRSQPFIVNYPPIYNDEEMLVNLIHSSEEEIFSKPGTYVKPVFPFQRIPERNYPEAGLTAGELEMLNPQENLFSKEVPLPGLPRDVDAKHEKVMKMVEAFLKFLELHIHQTSDQRRKHSVEVDEKLKIEDEIIPHVLGVSYS